MNAVITLPVATVKAPQNPTQCPICHVTQVPFYVNFPFDYPAPAGLEMHTKKLSNEEIRIERVYKCVNKDCERLFIALYHGRLCGMVLDYSDVRLLPFEGEARVSQVLKDISPKFVKIYSQACIAERLGLTEVAGPGFRKALETLVREYAMKSERASSVEVLERITTGNLGRVIVEFIDDQYVREAAQRATWLGNDQSHYEGGRLWGDQGLKELMSLLNLTMTHIERREQHLEMLKAMPEGKSHATRI
jgi:hypothetical protein